MKVLLVQYSECKYWGAVKPKSEDEFFIERYEVQWISDEEATRLGFSEIDESGQYLILHLENGTTKVFCNTHVDLYKL